MAYGIPFSYQARSSIPETYNLPGYSPDEDIFTRLLSPDEFDQLPPGGAKASMNGYMDYVREFQRQQKQLQQRGNAGTQRVNQGGLWSVAAAGTPMTTTGGRQGAVTKGGAAIPDYRIHTTMGGKPVLEARGGRRTIEGEYIPTNLDELQEEEQLKYAIPKIREQAELDYLTTKAARVGKQGEIDYPKRLEAAEKMAQGQERIRQGSMRIDIAQQRADQVNKRYYDGLNVKVRQATLDRDLKKGLLERTYELKGINDSEKEDLRIARDYLIGNVPGSPQAIARNKEYAQRAMEIADNAYNNSVKMEDKKEAAQAQRDILNYISRLNIQESTLFGTQKTAVKEKITKAEQQLEQSYVTTPQTQMTQADFVNDFTAKVGRAPTPTEIQKAQGKYWQ